MGQACGCADSTASKQDEIANGSAADRQPKDKNSNAPGVQNRNAKKTPWETQDTQSYKSDTQE